MTRVAVVKGGWSNERPVSLMTGAQIADAARGSGHDVVEIDARRDLLSQLADARPDVILNALHGPWGEDGCVQGVFEFFGKPYSHSGVLASALAMDKARARAVFVDAGLDVAEGFVAPAEDVARDHPMDPPYVVKPIAEGSSFGVHLVPKGANGPARALAETSWAYGKDVLVEAFIPGKELTVAVQGEEPLAVTEIVPLREHYDYEAKYAVGGSRHVIPAILPAEVTEAALDAAVRAHKALGCRGLTRSDFRFDETTGRLVILETNTQPGMTPTSLAPEQAAYRGVSFPELVNWMIEDASCPR